MTRLIIFAPNVASSGGLVLLRSLLYAAQAQTSIACIIDRRGEAMLADSPPHDAYWTTSTPWGRMRAEWELRRIARDGDVVLCFHNLPPLLPVDGLVYCYVHNPNLVGLVPVSRNKGFVRARYVLERFVARQFRGRIDRYFVQTPTMARALRALYKRRMAPVDVLPFLEAAEPVANFPAKPVVDSTSARWDFIYVSDGAAHKNHVLLFEAWRILAEEGCFPTLAVTLHPQRDADLRTRLGQLINSYGLKIEDLGQRSHAEILQCYGQSGALIFPSYAESFGIPLMEAEAAGLPILAAERDFVRDVCEPTITFDPMSALSIARAVTRFRSSRRSAVPLLSPSDFVRSLLDRERAIEVSGSSELSSAFNGR